MLERGSINYEQEKRYKIKTLETFVLNGREKLEWVIITERHERTTVPIVRDGKNSSEYRYKMIESNKKVIESFPLKKVSIAELKQLRKGMQAGFVLKDGEEIFYARIRPDLKMSNNHFFKCHKCGECHRLSAAPDEKGGCAKVRDIAKCIEDYKWIKLGCETFNVAAIEEIFVVAQCEHYVQEIPKIRKYNREQINNMLLSLLQYLHPEIDV